MESYQTSSTSPVAPVNRPVGSKKKLISILVAIVIILAIVIVGLVLFKNMSLSSISSPGVGGDQTPAPLTDEEKAKVMETLQQEAEQTPALTETEKADVMKILQQEAKQTPPLTDEEKAKIIKTLQGN